MDRRSGSRNVHHHGQRRAALPHRVMAGRRLSFRSDHASALRRINQQPLEETPHIPEASRYFSNFQPVVAEPRNEHERAEGSGTEVLIPELNDNAGGAQRRNSSTNPVAQIVPEVNQIARATNKPRKQPQRRQRRGTVTSMGFPKHPNLQRTLNSIKQFTETAEQEAREINSHRLCASKKIHSWERLMDQGINLRCAIERASQAKDLTDGHSRVVGKLQIVNERVEEIIAQFKQRLENERKTLKLERGRDSKRRVCCKICASK
ncbi:unnamed protein product [Orchesella dallaii]|uniref:Uncharacterized protein n=1 Tax=Orchesella dallaii TaxID=48710 RepID=A0ABP1R7C8_9HEXA